MSSPVHILRTAWRALLQHAGNVARSSGREAIGWLLGFYVGDAAYVLDAHPATRYKHQSKYGAIADPTEEAEIAEKTLRHMLIVVVLFRESCEAFTVFAVKSSVLRSLPNLCELCG